MILITFIFKFYRDIIKLTAQFIAKNGEHFRGGLAAKERDNPQFDFMKFGHPAFSLFNTLVDCYSVILRPPRDNIEQLIAAKSKSRLLDSILKRVEWERYQIKSREDPEQKEREEREARAKIDWHSFVIVETITFEAGENLERPKDFSGQKKTENNDDDDMDMDVDMEMDDDMDTQSTVNLQIRKDYKPSFPGSSNKKISYQRCPVCFQDIPVDELDEHVRIELMDPRFAKQQNVKSKVSSSLAQGSDIASGLESLKPHRTDIFGEDEDLTIGKVDAPDPDKVIWDGHSSSAHTISSINEQIEAIHEAQGYKPKPADLNQTSSMNSNNQNNQQPQPQPQQYQELAGVS